MSTHKHFDFICIVVIIFALVLTVIFMNGEKLGINKLVDEDAENADTAIEFTAKDEKADWDRSGATTIRLEGESGVVSGDGAYFLKNVLYIVKAGEYSLSGDFSGSVVVDTTKKAKVFIALNGVNISNEEDAALKILKADKVFLTLEEASENVISTGAEYSVAAQKEGISGAVYAKNDLTINGGGSLRIETEYQHGIQAKDDLVITEGNITVTAVKDALHVKNHFKCKGAELLIRTGDDGIRSDQNIFISGGNIQLEKCYEGLEAPDIEITGGNIVIHAEDDGINACGSEGTTKDHSGTEKDNSMPRVTISGGTVSIYNSQGMDVDGIDSNGDIYITGGTVFISLLGNGINSALDYGSESGGSCVIHGGTVIAAGGSGMLEAMSDASEQPSVIYQPSQAVGDDSAFVVKTSSGKELMNTKIPYSYSAVVFSCPEMKVGDTLVVQTGDLEATIEITEVATVSGASVGNFGPGGFGPGGFGQGGFKPGEGQPGDFNPGEFEAEDFNPGDFNPEDFEAGDFNPGDFTPGDFNPGDFEAGDFNPGDFNPGGFKPGNRK